MCFCGPPNAIEWWRAVRVEKRDVDLVAVKLAEDVIGEPETEQLRVEPLALGLAVGADHRMAQAVLAGDEAGAHVVGLKRRRGKLGLQEKLERDAGWIGELEELLDAAARCFFGASGLHGDAGLDSRSVASESARSSGACQPITDRSSAAPGSIKNRRRARPCAARNRRRSARRPTIRPSTSRGEIVPGGDVADLEAEIAELEIHDLAAGVQMKKSVFFSPS